MQILSFILIYFPLLFGYSTIRDLPSDGKKVWKENNGIVIIEAENNQDKKSNENGWKLKKIPKGYTGKGYYQWNGVGLWHKPSAYDSLPAERILTYYFEIEKEGVYYAKLRNYHLQEDGDNDVFLSINKSDWNKVYDHQESQWTWDENGKWEDKYPHFFKKGIYILQLGGRSVGFGVDKIALFHETLAPDPWSACDTTLWSDTKESKTYWLK